MDNLYCIIRYKCEYFEEMSVSVKLCAVAPIATPCVGCICNWFRVIKNVKLMTKMSVADVIWMMQFVI
jgi:hypothetical protein